MAPQGAHGVEVAGWSDRASDRADVVVELFGGGRPAGALAPILVDVEHLSAETYVERSHGLPSPGRRDGEPPSTTWFFYPGFTAATGGLLREPGLIERRREFGRGDDWLASLGVVPRAEERRVCLFGYRNDAVPELVAARRGTDPASAGARPRRRSGHRRPRRVARAGQVARGADVTREPGDFDRLLWSCDLNLVRGEDSLVRAIWAGAPFVWQLYVQGDGAHVAKLAAFLDRFLAGAPPDLASTLRTLFNALERHRERRASCRDAGRDDDRGLGRTLPALARCPGDPGRSDHPPASLRRVETLEFEALRPTCELRRRPLAPALPAEVTP
jgi:uncharacterized repeat protein (TIGR03837 family)